MDREEFENRKIELDKERSEELMSAGMMDSAKYTEIKDRYDKRWEKLIREQAISEYRAELENKINGWERNHDLSENSADTIICEILSIVRGEEVRK